MIPTINFTLTNPDFFDIFYLKLDNQLDKDEKNCCWLQLVCNLFEYFDRQFQTKIHEQNRLIPREENRSIIIQNLINLHHLNDVLIVLVFFHLNYLLNHSIVHQFVHQQQYQINDFRISIDHYDDQLKQNIDNQLKSQFFSYN